jgi:hypothetical protein
MSSSQYAGLAHMPINPKIYAVDSQHSTDTDMNQLFDSLIVGLTCLFQLYSVQQQEQFQPNCKTERRRGTTQDCDAGAAGAEPQRTTEL